MIHRFITLAIENYKARTGKIIGNEKSKTSRKNKPRRGVAKMRGERLVTATLLASILFGGNAFATTYHVGTGQTYANLAALQGTTGQSLANGDVIVLHSDDSSLMQGFTIATGGSVQFNTDSPGHTYEINGSGFVYPFLNITGSNPLTLDLNNLTITRFVGDGGAIYSTGDSTFNGNTTFLQNVCFQNGGAIYSTGTITTAATRVLTFTDNRSAENGGAIYSTSAIDALGSMEFNSNSSGMFGPGSGGAIYTTSDLSLTGASIAFDSNRASNGGDGGAIYQSALPTGLLTIGAATSNITFTSNTAGGNGGAIYSTGAITTAANVLTFTENWSDVNGGAIYSTGTSMFKGNTTFNINYANSCGGAIYSTGAITTATDSVLIFKQNQSNVGGAIYSTGFSMFNGNTTFDRNYADGSGGAIYSTGSSMFNGDTTFVGNYLDNGSGGAIYSTGSSTFNGETTFDRNHLDYGDGGAIYSTGDTAFNGKTTFVGNYLDYGSGGAIYLTGSSMFDGNTSFNGNKADNGSGGAIYSSGSVVASGNMEFRNNTASNSGGAIYQSASTDSLILGGATSTIVFNGNSTQGAGGAIYTDNDVTIEGQSVTFSNNTSESHGGAIYALNSNVKIIGGISFTGNQAGIYDPYFNANSVQGDGGAIRMTGGTDHNKLEIQVTQTNALYEDNWAVLEFTLADNVTKEKRTIQNDISISGNVEAIFDVAQGKKLTFEGGIFVDGETYTQSNVGNVTIQGGGAVIFGSESRSYVTGTIALNDNSTLHLEYGALIGKSRDDITHGNKSGMYVGQFIADSGTVSQQFDYLRGEGVLSRNNQYGAVITESEFDFNHLWVKAQTAVIEDNTLFALPGVVWQPQTIYNLVETQLIDLAGTPIALADHPDLTPAEVQKQLFVTTGLNRGGFETGVEVTQLYNQPDMTGYYFRDFVYYVDDTGDVLTNASGNIVREYGLLGETSGNVYAVELLRTDEVIGVDTLYIDPSLKNRILSQRMGCCCPTNYDKLTASPLWNAWVEGYGTGGGVGNYKGKNGFDYSTGGMLVGVEKETISNHRLGFYYGYGSSWTTGRSISYNGRSENTFGGYLRLADDFGYSLLMGNLGHNNYRSNRFIDTALGRETFNSNFGANTSGAYLERGFDWKPASHTCLNPFAALQYSHLSTNWYNETTTADDRLAQTAKLGYESLRSLIGVRTQTMLYDRLNWNNAIHWEHEMSKNGAVVRDEYLTNNPDFNTRTVGNYGGRDWIVYGTGLEFAVTANLSLNAGYDLSFNKKATFHTGMGGMTYTF